MQLQAPEVIIIALIIRVNLDQKETSLIKFSTAHKKDFDKQNLSFKK
jgi:hypothetical protein